MTNINIKQLEQRLINSSNKPKNISSELPKKSFNEVLGNIEHRQEIKFSKHATERLNSREISLSNDEMKKLEDAFIKAENKGVKDALILMDNKAFIANINNKTVITTVDRDSLEDKIFTNIDGAVII